MRDAGISGGWVEKGLLGLAASNGSSHGVVGLQNGVFGAVVAVGFFVFAFDDGKGIHDVVAIALSQPRECQ